MLADAGPNWLGSPQHYDTLADLASSLGGAIVGATIAVFRVPRLPKGR